MDSREKILRAVERNQPSGSPLMDSFLQAATEGDAVAKFMNVLKNIGGSAVRVHSWLEVIHYVQENFKHLNRIVSPVDDLAAISDAADLQGSPHLLSNVDLAIFRAHFGVAENGAAWLTDTCMGDRALPFISQHIALVIQEKDILHTMHEAYERIGNSDHKFGTFIAGPSKTADIEQSLVLGAHGPKSMTVFLMD